MLTFVLLWTHQTFKNKEKIKATWSSNSLATWCEEPTHWKRPWCWGKLTAKGGGRGRGGAGWKASPTPWTWVGADSGRWWRTGKPGGLQSLGSRRAGHDLVTEQQQTKWKKLVEMYKMDSGSGKIPDNSSQNHTVGLEQTCKFRNKTVPHRSTKFKLRIYEPRALSNQS